MYRVDYTSEKPIKTVSITDFAHTTPTKYPHDAVQNNVITENHPTYIYVG